LYPSWMRALGVDHGRRRIGLALSDASGMLARPWKTIDGHAAARRAARAIAEEIDALARADEPVSVVVIGHPRRLSGEPSDQTALVQAVAAELEALVGMPVVLQDERLSSREAERYLAQRERDWRKRKAQLDAMAAAVILQDYLDTGAARDAAAPVEPVGPMEDDER
jgi:putative Holliday junction resolvase